MSSEPININAMKEMLWQEERTTCPPDAPCIVAYPIFESTSDISSIEQAQNADVSNLSLRNLIFTLLYERYGSEACMKIRREAPDFSVMYTITRMGRVANLEYGARKVATLPQIARNRDEIIRYTELLHSDIIIIRRSGLKLVVSRATVADVL